MTATGVGFVSAMYLSVGQIKGYYGYLSVNLCVAVELHG